MKTITVKTGEVVFVDDDDFEWLNQFTWSSTKSKTSGPYVRTGIRNVPENRMHRLILWRKLGPSSLWNKYVDHANGNTLDNRKSNLRIATRSENKANGVVYARNKTGFRGVGWHTAQKKYWARIRQNNEQYNLGYFKKPEDAARAYDKAAERLFGRFARKNFP